MTGRERSPCASLSACSSTLAALLAVSCNAGMTADRPLRPLLLHPFCVLWIFAMSPVSTGHHLHPPSRCPLPSLWPRLAPRSPSPLGPSQRSDGRHQEAERGECDASDLPRQHDTKHVSLKKGGEGRTDEAQRSLSVCALYYPASPPSPTFQPLRGASVTLTRPLTQPSHPPLCRTLAILLTNVRIARRCRAHFRHIQSPYPQQRNARCGRQRRQAVKTHRIVKEDGSARAR